MITQLRRTEEIPGKTEGTKEIEETSVTFVEMIGIEDHMRGHTIRKQEIADIEIITRIPDIKIGIDTTIDIVVETTGAKVNSIIGTTDRMAEETIQMKDEIIVNMRDRGKNVDSLVHHPRRQSEMSIEQARVVKEEIDVKVIQNQDANHWKSIIIIESQKVPSC